jgi:hypothetical protein
MEDFLLLKQLPQSPTHDFYCYIANYSLEQQEAVTSVSVGQEAGMA